MREGNGVGSSWMEGRGEVTREGRAEKEGRKEGTEGEKRCDQISISTGLSTFAVDVKQGKRG